MFRPTFCTDLVPYLNLILFVNADLLVLVFSTDRNWEHSVNHWRDSSNTEAFYIYFTGVLYLLFVTSIKWNEPFKTTRKICIYVLLWEVSRSYCLTPFHETVVTIQMWSSDWRSIQKTILLLSVHPREFKILPKNVSCQHFYFEKNWSGHRLRSLKHFISTLYYSVHCTYHLMFNMSPARRRRYI